MSQRAVLGPHTRRPIAIVREHGTRVECIGIEPWFVPQLLGFLLDVWDGHNCWLNGMSPERTTMEALA